MKRMSDRAFQSVHAQDTIHQSQLANKTSIKFNNLSCQVALSHKTIYNLEIYSVFYNRRGDNQTINLINQPYMPYNHKYDKSSEHRYTHHIYKSITTQSFTHTHIQHTHTSVHSHATDHPSGTPLTCTH